MKLIASLFLFLFIAFLSTPTIVTMIEKSCDTSMFFNISEEEHHSHKEIKNFVYTNNSSYIGFNDGKINKSSLILSENLSKHDNVSASIFAPPPNFA
ncbi:hypothetical protein ACMDB5_08510 [Flavobacterium sp. W1B]|uniref:hypothetical protein n=1 Tax=Flavobacterium sp. W1B TaxID=3394146 RepID=UPI0039BC8D55